MKSPAMPRKSTLATGPAKLPRRVGARSSSQPLKARVQKSEAEAGRLLLALQAHEIELELQNAELQATKNELEVALEKYTDLYDFAPVGYFSLTTNSTINLVNLTGARLVGVDRSQLVGQLLEQHVTADLQSIFRAFLKRVFADGTKRSCEVTLLSKGRSARTVTIEAQRSPHRQECRAMVVDITERERADEILRRNEALFSVLIEQAPVGVYVVDGHLRMQQVNPKAQPFFSKVHPLHGRDFSEVIHIIWSKKVAAEIERHFRFTLKTGKTYYSPEFSERRRDTGKTEFYDWQIQRITLPSGDHGVVCFFNNITERKQVEATQRAIEVLAASNEKLEVEIARRQAKEEFLKQNEQHKSQLLAQAHRTKEQLQHLSRRVLRAQEEERKRISRELHDVIAQTLAGINVRLGALKMEASVNAEGLEQNIAITQQLVQKSVEVVHRFARELRPSVLDDLGLIPALRTFLETYKEETGIRVSLSAFAAVEQVNGDKRTVLYRVAQEALANVARHAHASEATVKIEKLDGAVCLKIIDNGKGFPAERVLHAKKQKRLGLLGMRERVEMVNGTFAIESALGQGTTIQAQIPLTDGRTPKVAASTRSKPSRNGRKT